MTDKTYVVFRIDKYKRLFLCFTPMDGGTVPFVGPHDQADALMKRLQDKNRSGTYVVGEVNYPFVLSLVSADAVIPPAKPKRKKKQPC